MTKRKTEVSVRFLEAVDYLLERKVEKSARQLMFKFRSTSQTLTEIRAGRQEVSLKLIREIAKHYGVNLYWLLFGEEPMMRSNDALPSRSSVYISITNAEMKERILKVVKLLQEAYKYKSLRSFFENELELNYTTFMAYKNGQTMAPPKGLISNLEKLGANLLYLFAKEMPEILSKRWNDVDYNMDTTKNQDYVVIDLQHQVELKDLEIRGLKREIELLERMVK